MLGEVPAPINPIQSVWQPVKEQMLHKKITGEGKKTVKPFLLTGLSRSHGGNCTKRAKVSKEDTSRHRAESIESNAQKTVIDEEV